MPSTGVGALLERERELETLREGLERAGAGEGTLLLIEGPAGVGKTKLVGEARAAARHAHMTVLEAKGSELEQPFAFGAVRQLLDPVVEDASARGELFAGGAALAARLFEPDEGHKVSADLGFEALHSLYWLIVNLADRVPLLVSVDDCQWVDRDSLRFLAYLAQRIDGLPVAMLLAGRQPDPASAEAGALWAQVTSRPATAAIYPHPLSEAAAIDMARERLGDDAAEEFCRACHAATGGNPLFLGELLRALYAAGITPSPVAAEQVHEVGPAAVSRFVLHRLDALGPAPSELARAVAVLGDDSELRLGASVAGLSVEQARDAADDLVRADIFAREERLGFVHPIVRAALYEDLTPGERQARHAAVADALEREGASPERITAHLLLTPPSGDERRVATLRASALGAARRGSPRAAAARLRRALAESPANQERAEILVELGRVEVAALDFEAAHEHLNAALTSDGELATRAAAASTLVRCAIVSGGHSAEVAVDALAALAEELRPLDAERALELRSELLMLTTAVPASRAELAGQLSVFAEQARGRPGFEAVARIHAAVAELLAGALPAELAADEVQAALSVGLPPAVATQAAFVGLLVLRVGERYDFALRALAAALEPARREGHAARQGIIHGQRAEIALAQGSLHDAQVEAETGLVLIEEPHFTVLQLLAIGITVHIERGDLDEAERLAGRGGVLGTGEDQTYLAWFLVARARLRLAQGRPREALADLLWCGERLDVLGLRWPSDWRAYAIAALASLDEHARARTFAEEQLEIARRVAAPGALGMSLRLAARAFDDDQRLALLEESVAVLEGSSARLELAHALADLGGELGRLGRRREARDLQRRAIELADECGATVLAERARSDFHSGPGRRARAELTGPGALTAAEWRVCRQAAEGLTNREIAEALFVTEKTVERHLSSAYHKLGIRSRFQLQTALRK